MKHKIKLRKLNISSSHRKSLFINLSNSLIKYEIIKTTIIKAKELRKILEPIINLGKFPTSSNIKYIFNKLRNIDSVFKLIKILSPRYINRNGGYLGIYKVKFKKGDNSLLVFIKFI